MERKTTAYLTEWPAPDAPISPTSVVQVIPAFGARTYTFTIRCGHAAGTVSTVVWALKWNLVRPTCQSKVRAPSAVVPSTRTEPLSDAVAGAGPSLGGRYLLRALSHGELPPAPSASMSSPRSAFPLGLATQACAGPLMSRTAARSILSKCRHFSNLGKASAGLWRCSKHGSVDAVVAVPAGLGSRARPRSSARFAHPGAMSDSNCSLRRTPRPQDHPRFPYMDQQHPDCPARVRICRSPPVECAHGQPSLPAHAAMAKIPLRRGAGSLGQPSISRARSGSIGVSRKPGANTPRLLS
jgi:hypothetical protein